MFFKSHLSCFEQESRDAIIIIKNMYFMSLNILLQICEMIRIVQNKSTNYYF